ncbi:MAG TPA: PmoA family protein [Terriglobia bacterium]|nr:PmoA family protein [Terriglobia bacterium]
MKRKFSELLIVFLALVFISSVALGAAQPVTLMRSGFRIDVLIGGRLFTTYYFDPSVAKPYFRPLRSAQGTIVTRNFPSGDTVPPQDLKDPNLEPHQRPMDFGHGNVDGIDFWGEAAFPKWSDDSIFGRTVFRKLEEIHGGPEAGVLRADFDLVAPRGRVIGVETQSYTFRGDQRNRIVDCEFIITANHGAPITMGDTKEGTFEIRLAKTLNSPPAHMVNSLGGQGEKEIWGKRADWVDYDGAVDGEQVGVAIFDSPHSFRHPTYWHARAYGLFAANPFGIREFTRDPKRDGSWTIEQSHSLRFQYRVLIHHGNYIQAGVAKAYAAYAARQ